MGTTRRQFPDESKREALELLASSGWSLSQIATELGIDAAGLRAWRNTNHWVQAGSLFHVGWAMRDHMRAELTTAALTMAIQRQQPPPGRIHHADRGSQHAPLITAAISTQPGSALGCITSEPAKRQAA